MLDNRYHANNERYRLSLRAKRRSLIAALTVGGSLAVAGSAAALPVPIGSSSDPAYSGTGTPTSVYSLYNAASGVLVQAQNLIVGANGVATANHTSPVDANFSTDFTTASQLTSSNVSEIATDISTSGNANDLEIALCVAYEEGQGQSQSAAFAICDPTPPAQFVTEFTGTVQPGVASSAASWPDLSQLVSFLGGASGVMQSADSATVSSSGTISSLTDPVAYNVTLSAPSGGYIVPSAFALTFPQGLGVNTALVADEVNASTNTAAVELNPTGTSIGTVTLTSPLADEFGGANNQLVGKVYVVQTGQSSGQGSVTQPYLELWFPAGGHPIYDLGAFPSNLSFPLTLSFPEAFVSLLNAHEPLPLNSLALTFPAATSPVKATSCTSLGTVGGAITDSIAGLAYEFGDKNDGVSSATGTPAPVQLSATATAVTNDCATAAAPAKARAIASGARLTSGSPTIRVKATSGTAFRTVTISLPRGLRFNKASAKKLAKEIRASKVRSVRIVRGKLVVSLRSAVKSETIQTKRRLISESAGLIKSIKKHKTKMLTLRVGIGSATVRARFRA